ARDYYDMGHAAGELAARVIRGEKPADIPFHPMTTSRLYLNRESAKQCGIELTDELLREAHQVFEREGAVMEIETAREGGFVELRVRGMLDSTWAQHLSSAVDDVVRAGAHRVLVDLAGVTYLSSAGISHSSIFRRKLLRSRGSSGRAIRRR